MCLLKEIDDAKRCGEETPSGIQHEHAPDYNTIRVLQKAPERKIEHHHVHDGDDWYPNAQERRTEVDERKYREQYPVRKFCDSLHARRA